MSRDVGGGCSRIAKRCHSPSTTPGACLCSAPSTEVIRSHPSLTRQAELSTAAIAHSAQQGPPPPTLQMGCKTRAILTSGQGQTQGFQQHTHTSAIFAFFAFTFRISNTLFVQPQIDLAPAPLAPAAPTLRLQDASSLRASTPPARPVCPTLAIWLCLLLWDRLRCKACGRAVACSKVHHPSQA